MSLHRVWNIGFACVAWNYWLRWRLDISKWLPMNCGANIGEIAWEDGDAKYVIRYAVNDIADFDCVWGYECEVIGNIHDNPELLGKESG